MPFCASCGNNISHLAVACPKCGTPNAFRPEVAPQQTSALPAVGVTYTNAPVLRPLSIGEIIDVSIKLYRNNFLTLLKVVAVVVAPVQLIAALIQSSSTPSDANSFVTIAPGATPGSTTPHFNTSVLWTLVGGLLVTVVLGALASQLATAASLKAVADAYLGEKPKASPSLEFAISKLGALLWLAFLTFICTALGFLLCFIPGFILTVIWTVSIPALLIENKRGFAALNRSQELSKGRFWQIVGVLLLGRIIAGILGAILGAAFGAAFAVSGTSELARFVTSALSGTIAQILVTPFLAAMIAILYFDLRVRKEGLDVELLALGVGGSATGAVAGLTAPGWEGQAPQAPQAPQGPPPRPGMPPGLDAPGAPPPPPRPAPKRMPRRPGWTPEDDATPEETPPSA